MRFTRPKKYSSDLKLSLPLHLACATDELMMALQNIYFNDGRIYITDAHIAIRIPLSALFKSEPYPPDGTYLTADQFRLIHNKPHYVTPEGIYLKKYDCIVKFKTEGDNLIAKR